MIKLSNGYSIPEICFGTDIVSDELFADSTFIQLTKRVKCFAKNCVKIILHKDIKKYKKDLGIIRCTQVAMKYKCNFFDTSRAYLASEKMLGQALIKEERSEYFICTKIDNHSQLEGIPAKDTLKKSMRELGVSYVDVLLLHWPVEGKYLDYWKQLEDIYESGLAKVIGVSNCKIHHLEEIKKRARIIPMINEVELHPLLSEKELLNYCKQNGVQIMAYTSTARLDFRLRESRRMKSVCEKYGKSLAQVILRWHIQNGIIPIFNTSTVSHLKSNMNVFDFELDKESMKLIDSLNINSRTRFDSDNCEWDRL